VSLFTDWQKKRINEVWLKHRMENGKSFDAPPEFYGAKRAHEESASDRGTLRRKIAPSRWACPAHGTTGCRHFRMGFTPSAGKELQAEYFCGAQETRLMRSLPLKSCTTRFGPHLLITEIRTIAADNFWMSPLPTTRDSVTIHFTLKPDWPAVSKLLPVIEKELAPFHGAPPTGEKLFTMVPAHLDSLYEKTAGVYGVEQEVRPRGKVSQ